MPYKNPKDRKKQVNKPVGSKEFKARMERQRARQKMDREGIDRNNNGKADKRSYRGRTIEPKEKRPEYVLFSDLYPYAVQEDDLVRYKQRPEYAEDGEPHYDY